MACALVVDSDGSASAAIRSVLELEGFEVVVADSGRAGAKAVESSLFDVVIVDIFPPHADGLDAVKTLRELAPRGP